MNIDHPYKNYENLRIWEVLERGIADLAANGDLEEKTASCYIVGYLARMIDEAGLIGPTAPSVKQATPQVRRKQG